jgi:putative ABC transport system permease protein
MYMGDDRFAVTMAPLGPAVKAEIPEVEQSSRIARGWNPLIRAGDETHLERGIYGIDPDAFKIFTFEYVSGNPDSFLKEKYTAVITESVAKRYYQDQEPVGQTLQYEDKEQFKVVGVIKDMPVNSHFRMDIMIPFETLLEITNSARNLQEWGNSSYYTYILLHEGRRSQCDGSQAGNVGREIYSR